MNTVNSEMILVNEGQQNFITSEPRGDIEAGKAFDVKWEVKVQNNHDFHVKVRVELWTQKPDTHTIVLKKTNGWRGSCTFFKGHWAYEFELSLNLDTEKRKICITVHSWITVRIEIPYTNLNVSSDWSSFKNPDQKVIDQIQRQLDKAKKSKPKSQVEIIRNQVLVEDLSYLLCNDRNALKKAIDQAKTDANSGQAGADVLLALGVTVEGGAGKGGFVGAGIWGAYGSESGFDCGLYFTIGYGFGALFGASMQGTLSIVGRDNNIAGKNAVEMFRSPYYFAKVSGGEDIVFSVCFYFGEEGISGVAVGVGVGGGWPLNVYAGAGLTFIVGTQNELASATGLSRSDGEKRDNVRGG